MPSWSDSDISFASSGLGKEVDRGHSWGHAPEGEINLNSLYVPCIAEKALIYLFAEVNLITEQQLKYIVDEIGLDKRYMERTLADNRRPVAFT